jgi:hypothetical protein
MTARNFFAIDRHRKHPVLGLQLEQVDADANMVLDMTSVCCRAVDVLQVGAAPGAFGGSLEPQSVPVPTSDEDVRDACDVADLLRIGRLARHDRASPDARSPTSSGAARPRGPIAER